MATKCVLEIGPGTRPSAYAFDPGIVYLGVDPDMHYFVSYHFKDLIADIRSQRGNTSNFEYRPGQTVGDLLGELACTQDIVVMANVLGDPGTYRGEYSGLFVDPESGATRRTDIKTPGQLVVQALQCLRPGGTLTVVEDATRQRDLPDHTSPEEFEKILTDDTTVSDLVGEYALFRRRDYLNKIYLLYPDLDRQEPTTGYFDTCFIAEVERV